MTYQVPGAPDDKWREIRGAHPNAEPIIDEPHDWQDVGHVQHHGFEMAAPDPMQHGQHWQYSAQSNLYWQTIEERAREALRGASQSQTFEFTIETDLHSDAFALLFWGMTRAQHDLLHRLNVTWKYRIDPGQPESVRRYMGGLPERTLQPVVVTVDGRDIEALAEIQPGKTTLYPAHPKGNRTK